jgi:histidine triad (HIT) family protein
MVGCVFCRIARGEAPSTIVYEDESTLGIVPLEKVVEGHTLVIPKAHFESIFDVDDLTLAAVTVAAKRIAVRLIAETGATGVNVLHASGVDAQQSVFHLHFHVVPRRPEDGLDLWIRDSSELAREIER